MKKIKNIFDRIESIILGLCIVGVFFLIIQLGFIKNIEMPTFYNLYEEFDKNELLESREAGYVIIKKNIKDFEKINVKINGKGKYKFDQKNELKLKVYNNDKIEIDSTMYEEEIEIIVVGISKNIKKPKLNEKIKVKGSTETLWKVKTK